MSDTPVHRVRSYRELADILLAAAFNIGLALALTRLLDGIHPTLALFAVPLGTLAFIWLLLTLRGQGWADIGLGRPKRWDGVLAVAAAIAAGLFAVALATEAMGFQRDLSGVRNDLEGNLPFLFAAIAYAFIGAGLYEEVLFRGFLMHRFAHLFGAGRRGWALAAVAQGVVFGLAHYHQGAYGMVYTGVLSIGLAAVFLMNGRRLWPLVLGHGLYDAARFVYFYVLWTYGA